MVIRLYTYDMPYTSALHTAQFPNLLDRPAQFSCSFLNRCYSRHPVCFKQFLQHMIQQLLHDLDPLQNFSASHLY